MYDLDLVRSLCAEISTETDTEKIEELLSLLQAIIKENLADTRARLEFIRQKYAFAITESDPAA